ncbi:MAG: peptidoglycan glycosyltransferase [Clostridiaceae bacterium]|nr:peptidoglycan glycosyltransferase [Clostridiaceae bacterium]
MISPNRLRFLVIAIIFLFLCLLGRFYYLQVVEADTLTRQVTRQRALDTTLKYTRGYIYDRNMIPFTDREDRYYIIVIPGLIKDGEKVIGGLSGFTGYSREEIEETFREQVPVTYIVENYLEQEIREVLDDPSIKIIPLSKRYGKESLARHIIGYVNEADQTGFSGIEKAFDSYLNERKPQSIGMVGDAIKRSIPGLGYRVINCFSNNEGEAVRLTLDYHIQSIVEKVMDKRMGQGAVIVTDVKSGDILALASRPNYDQEHVEQYIDSDGSELVNRVFSPYDAGSIFKIVVAAAALEKNTVSLDTPFTCTGYIDVDDMAFMCHKSDGHGELSFMEGFANSCNPVFIDTGLKVGYKSIIEMAKRFGFGSSLYLFDGLIQEKGNIPDKKYVSARETANISIGQGEILVTPIQVADMVTTIANNGVRKKLNLVDAIVMDDGSIVKDMRIKGETRIISAEVAKKIQRMMEEVTLSGTGANVRMEHYGGVAGKTGSAETGWVMENGSTKVHAWFAGYFPIKDPKYAMVVFVENGRQGGSAAAPVFRDIAEEIMKLNR